MNDKEKIEEVLQEIDNFMKWHGTEKYKQSDMKNLLKEIVKILEKRSLTDEQGYQEALELDEEERLVLLKKEEKLEVVLKIIREKGGDSYNYTPSLLLGEVRKILES